MVFLHETHGYFYLAVKLGKKIKHIKALGKISKEQAIKKLEEWNKQLEKPLEPKSIYRTIVLDPPWLIDKISRRVRPNQKKMDYTTMTLEEIKNFSLKKFVSSDGAHIYLWTTQKHLQDAFEVLDAWGVKYQCLLTWIKNVGITPFSWMYSTEFVLFGRIGHLDLIRKGIRTDFQAKVREHSRKPNEFYEIVKRASPDPRIDIFSREKREGFDSYGYETNKF